MVPVPSLASIALPTTFSKARTVPSILNCLYEAFLGCILRVLYIPPSVLTIPPSTMRTLSSSNTISSPGLSAGSFRICSTDVTCVLSVAPSDVVAPVFLQLISKTAHTTMPQLNIRCFIFLFILKDKSRGGSECFFMILSFYSLSSPRPRFIRLFLLRCLRSVIFHGAK